MVKARLVAALWVALVVAAGPAAAAQAPGPAEEVPSAQQEGATQEEAAPAQPEPPSAQGEPTAGAEAEAQPGKPSWSPSFSAQGDSLWSLSYGWGDPSGLRGRPDVVPGQPAFRQELRLKLSGEVAQGVSVSADLDNLRGENVQLVGIDLKWGALSAHLGDIQLRSVGRYAVSQATLKGVSLSAELGDWTLTGVAGRAQGIPASKTFTGATSEERLLLVERLAARDPPYAPAREAGGLAADVRGVEGLPLSRPYDAEFTRVWLRPYERAEDAAKGWPPDDAGSGSGGPCQPSSQGGRTLKELLAQYGLGDLYFEPGQPEGRQGVLRPWEETPGAGGAVNDPARSFLPLSTGQVTGVATPGGAHPARLLLAVESLDLLRAHVEALIGKFNEQNRRTGSQRLRYPLVRGSDTEREFLRALRAYFTLQAGTGQHPKDPAFQAASDEVALEAVGTCRAFRERLGAGEDGVGGSGTPTGGDIPFYLLGQTQVEAASVRVEARRRSGGALQDGTALGISWEVFPREGVLRVAFPGGLGAFLNDYDALVVRYRYTSSEGVYVLGTAVAAGSERVYLNGQRLSRDVDYTIDYETGVLMLLRPVGSTDQLRVDFEYFRGGLGAAAEYRRNTFALGGRWRREGSPWQFGAEVFFEGDEPRPLVEPARARTMPESHTVAAISLAYRPPGTEWQQAAEGLAGAGRPQAGGWLAELDLAFSHDVFPFDDNRRVNQPNRVEAIAGGAGPGGEGTFVLVGHHAGLTVGYQRESTGALSWHSYDAGSGLSGLTVYDVAAAWEGASSDGSFRGDSADPAFPWNRAPGAWILATESGLTVVANAADVGGAPSTVLTRSPFDRTDNWARRYRSDGLPDNDVRAVLFVGVKTRPPGASQEGVKAALWVGTAKGVAWAEADELTLADAAAQREALKSWHLVEASGFNLQQVEIRDLAFVPVECSGPAGCEHAWVAGATPRGLLLIAVGTRDDSTAIVLDSTHTDLSAVAAVPLRPNTARVFVGGPEGLRYGDVTSTGRGIDWRGPIQGVRDVRGLQAIAELTNGQPTGGHLWIGAAGGLGHLRVSGDGPGSLSWVTGSEGATAVGVARSPNGLDAAVWAASRTAAGGITLLFNESVGSSNFNAVQTGTEPDSPAIPAEDPARFADVPAAAHTRTGLAGRFAVGYGWEGGRLDAAVERVEPGFVPINGIRRQDVLSWNVGLRQRLTPALEVGLSHLDDTAADPQSGRRSRRLVDQLVADWTLPLPPPIAWASSPKLRGELRHERQGGPLADGFELVAFSRSVTLREELFGTRVTLGAGYERIDVDNRATPTQSYQAHNLVADVELTPLEGLKLTARYRRPLQVFARAGVGAVGTTGGGAAGSGSQRVGSQTLELSAAASRRVGLIEAGLDVSQQEGLRLTDEGSLFERISRQAAARLSTTPLQVGAWALTPSVRLRWQSSESLRSRDTRTGGESAVRGRWVPTRLEVELGGGREVSDAHLPGPATHAASKRSTRDTVRLSLTSEAWQAVRPTLGVEGSAERSVAQLGAGGQPLEAVTRRLGTTLQAAWKFDARWPQESRLGVRWTEGPEPGRGGREWEAGHRLGFEPGGPWSFAASATGRAGERLQVGSGSSPYWQAEVAGQAQYRFSKAWQAGLELGWLTGTRTSDGLGPGVTSAGSPESSLQSGWARLFVRARF